MAGPLPLIGYHATPSTAATVVAPPYDALDADQRRSLGADPDSFLGALPPRVTPGTATDEVLAGCRRRIDGLLRRGRFTPVDRPFVGVLRLRSGHHSATCVLFDLDVDAYRDGRVLAHEQVDDARVEDLARYLRHVEVASSPVAVVHRPSAALAAGVDDVTATHPRVRIDATDGVELTLWVVTDPATWRPLLDALDRAGRLHLADGHHRAAAAAHAAETPGAADGTTVVPRVLTAAFASDALRVLAFHRRIDGVTDPAATLRAVADAQGLVLEPCDPPDTPGLPSRPGTVTVTAAGRWCSVDIGTRSRHGPVERLDIRTVERELLGPLLAAAGSTATVVPVAAPAGPGALAGGASVGVALHPPTVEDVLAVADAGQVLPRKTTYMHPKLRSGLLLVPRPRWRPRTTYPRVR